MLKVFLAACIYRTYIRQEKGFGMIHIFRIHSSDYIYFSEQSFSEYLHSVLGCRTNKWTIQSACCAYPCELVQNGKC